MRIALYGGSFNPPHIGHGLVCHYLLETAPLDGVWLIPTFKHAFGKPLVSYADRVEMCRHLAAPFAGRVQISRVEEERGEISFTIDTVRTLRARHPDTSFEWVVGADILQETARWRDFDTLTSLVGFRVLGRAGYPGGGGLIMPAVSSTDVRERLGHGKNVSDLVPRSVLSYIQEKRLYMHL